MKKATFITFIFAVLMIALLVSCNTTPDPLPSGGGETTTDAVPSTDGGGAAVEPSLTSEMAEVTTAEEEPGKTTYWASWEVSDVPPVVDVNATTLAPLPEIDPPHPNLRVDHEHRRYYLVPDEETLPEIKEPVKIADTDTPWYITEWETQKEYLKSEIPEDKQNYALRFPKTATVEMEEMKITVDFFQEYYRFGDPVQIQINIKNKTSDPIVLSQGLLGKYFQEYYLVGIVEGNDFKNPVGGIIISYFEDTNWAYTQQPKYPSRYNRYTYDIMSGIPEYMEYKIFPGKLEAYGIDREHIFSTPYNVFEDGMATLEYLLSTPAEKLDPTKEYAVIVTLCSTTIDRYSYLRIPIEIVEYESVSP
ncbi:MAG: hypothetical protein J6B77_09945 [Clostridia bacterium]|nr:hypothetical protein [Clostridia bacterium]